jgi:oligosaccharide reducing-end xylanase
MDAVWKRAPALPIRRVLFGQPSDDADLSATFRALWSRTGLYLLVEVRDDKRVNDSTQRYDDDGVEVYLDAGNKKSSTFGQAISSTTFPTARTGRSSPSTMPITRAWFSQRVIRPRVTAWK